MSGLGLVVGGGSRDRDRDRRLGLAGSIAIARPVDGREEKARRSRALCECSHMGSNDRGRIVVIVTVQTMGGRGVRRCAGGQWAVERGTVRLFALHHPVQTARRGTRGESPILSTLSESTSSISITKNCC